jgi:hypothetical protein
MIGKQEKVKAYPAPIKDYTDGSRHCFGNDIEILKKHQYLVKPYKISGDAPKDFISVYEYKRCRKNSPQKWINYIAKVGHKRYPSESLTEHLLTRLGEEWGFKMAKSKLYIIAGQLRFCSEFFLNINKQRLIHGADILASFLREADASMIEKIDQKGWSQELLTVQFVQQAIMDVFPQEGEKIYSELIELLLFDAIVGNNDRHFFNWV